MEKNSLIQIKPESITLVDGKVRLVEITTTTLKPGDVITIKNNPKSYKWLVLDVGHPFILIENLTTHFSYMYHPIDPIYKIGEMDLDPEIYGNEPQ